MAVTGTILTILFAAIALYQTTHWLYLVYFHPLASYPGPSLARFTNFWRVWSFCKGRQHLVDRELHARYGPFVRDGPESLLVSDVEAFKSIYGFAGKLNKGDFYAMSSNGNAQQPNIFSAKTEDLHRVARKKLSSTAFAPKHISQYEAAVTENVLAFSQCLDRQVKIQGGIFNIAPICERLIFDALNEATYGSSMGMVPGGDPAGIISSKKEAYLFTFAISHVPWLARLLATPSVSAFFRRPKFDEEGRPIGLSAIGGWSRKIQSEAISDSAHLNPCILRNLLEVDPSDSRKLSPEAMRFECFNGAVFAGSGSTAAGLIAALYEIGIHPEWQSRLGVDVDGLSETEYLSVAHLSKLDNLQAILKEALRLHPPFSGPFERVITAGAEGAVVNVKPLPAETRIWSSVYVMSRSEQVFGDRTDDFRPDRWLDNNSRTVKGVDDMFCIFGRGSRACIGQDLAWMILQKTVAAVVRKWYVGCGEGALQGKSTFEMHYDKLLVTLTSRT